MLRQRVTVAVTIAVLMVVATPTTALAHTGGESFTSNYRTRITDVTPASAHLKVAVSGLDDTLEVTWTGAGSVVIYGYEGEPYLRVSELGVERNTRSPATYLNLDRYAAVNIPAVADASAPPQWELISAGHTVRWHDHRTHWMDRVPPLQVRDNPDVVTVIYAQWQIPISVAGTDGAITGSLSWEPPSSAMPYLGLIAVGGLLLGALLAKRRWQQVALIALTCAAAAFTADSVAYLLASRGKALTVAWFIGWPILCLAACAWVALGARRRGPEPSVWLAITGIILAVVGGWDRRDVFNHSQIYSSLPDWATRGAAVTCIAVGTAVVTRYGIYLWRLVTKPPSRELN